MTRLEPHHHEDLIENGYVLVERLVPEALVTAARDALEETTSEWQKPKDGPVFSQDISRGDKLDACVTPAVHAAVADIFGPAHPFVPHRTTVDMPRRHLPDSDANVSPHVDIVHPVVMPDTWALAVFIFLTPVVAGGGAFLCAPGSAREMAAISRANNKDRLWTESRVDAWRDRFTELTPGPGDALMFHHLLVHSASSNRTNPCTRHALQVRFVPEKRVAPGAMCFDEMSTIDRLNSGRFLAWRFGDPAPPLEIDTEQREGRLTFSGLVAPGGIVAHDTIRRDGVTRLYFVAGDDPCTLRQALTRNGVAWDMAPAVLTLGDAITSVHVEQRIRPTLTVVTAGDPIASHVWSSQDLESWEPSATMAGIRLGAQHFAAGFGVKGSAAGPVALFSKPTPGGEVRWRSGPNRHDPSAPAEEGAVISVPDDLVVHDVVLQAVVDAQRFAVVLDVASPDGERHLLVSLTSFFDCCDEGLQPLRHSLPTPPRQLRLFERVKDCWLVTYVRDSHGVAVLRWGVVEWPGDQMDLRELETVEDLDAALAEVGLR